MAAIEELEQRVARLETLFEDVLKDRIDHIATRIDQLYEKTERDKSEILAKTERDKTELLEKMLNLHAKTEKDKRELILWMVGLTPRFFNTQHNSHLGHPVICIKTLNREVFVFIL